MPVTFSAKQRVRRNERACAVNRIRRGKIRAAEKLFLRAASSGERAKATELFPTVQSYLARGVKWNLVHRRRAGIKTAKFAAMLSKV
jgi:ribosomal protein S20